MRSGEKGVKREHPVRYGPFRLSRSDIGRIEEWPVKRLWLHQLGLTDHAIRTFDLSRHMSELAWHAMVREALREKRIHKGRKRWRRNAGTRSGDE